MIRILFLIKKHCHYGRHHYYICRGGGLSHSVEFIEEMLKDLGVPVKVVEVDDNNDIDREVTAFRPTHAIIEALWVVPEKFDILKRLHPLVHWIVRLHSELPFLAQEGIAADWIIDYVTRDVRIACNSDRLFEDLHTIIFPRDLIYLPNFYALGPKLARKAPDKVLDVISPGAIRPLKNQFIQAFAAINLAARAHKDLRFHVTSGRVEGGEEVLKNLEGLLGPKLIRHPWEPRTEFLKLLAQMDLGLQLSFTESFNLAAADMVSAGLPMVVSPEVRWTNRISQASPNDLDDIVRKAGWALRFPKLVRLNARGLNNFSRKAKQVWQEFIKSESNSAR